MKKILVIGATGGKAAGGRFGDGGGGAELFLLARNQERLTSLGEDLKVRGACSVRGEIFDANDFAHHTAVITNVIEQLGGLDLVLIAHGTLGDQKACEQDVALTLSEFNTNALSVISLLTPLANHFEKQGHGSIAVISSVAGDRGRQSNYVYGAAKGMLSIFLQGLRNRLFKSGVQVLTIKPGFVDTPMTAAFPKGPLWATPEKVAGDIDKAITRGKDELYTPGFWCLIMAIIRSIPEFIFKRLSL